MGRRWRKRPELRCVCSKSSLNAARLQKSSIEATTNHFASGGWLGMAGRRSARVWRKVQVEWTMKLETG